MSSCCDVSPAWSDSTVQILKSCANGPPLEDLGILAPAHLNASWLLLLLDWQCRGHRTCKQPLHCPDFPRAGRQSRGIRGTFRHHGPPPPPSCHRSPLLTQGHRESELVRTWNLELLLFRQGSRTLARALSSRIPSPAWASLESCPSLCPRAAALTCGLKPRWSEALAGFVLPGFVSLEEKV